MCEAYAWTEGSSCNDFCGRQGRDCLHAQKNVKESSCDLDPAHDRQDMSQNGCVQVWDSQICGCSAVKDVPTTNSSIISTRVLGLEYSSISGETLRMQDLEKPFVLELSLDEGIFACEAVAASLELCSGNCVPRGSCANREHQYCSFFNVELDSWEIDKNSPPGHISKDGRRVICAFDHLTDVVSFLGPSPAQKFNEPCFSCLSEFLQNPWGIVVVLTGFALLICAATGTACTHYRYSHRLPDEIALTKFAQARKRVTARDKNVETTLVEDVCHRLRHDFSYGGILCQLPGDPFDRFQRALLLVATLLVTLMVSLMFFQPDAESDPACVETCEQQDSAGEEVCTTVCTEPEKDGILISLATAVISLPMSVAITKTLQWLRRPIIVAVEPKEQKKASILMMYKTRKAAGKAKEWLETRTAAAPETTREKVISASKRATKVLQVSGAQTMPRALAALAEKERIAATGLRAETSSSDSDSDSDSETSTNRDFDLGIDDIEQIMMSTYLATGGKEEGTRPAAPLPGMAFAAVMSKNQFQNRVHKKKTSSTSSKNKPIVADLNAYVAAAIAQRAQLHKLQVKGNVPLPRKAVAVCIPVLVGLIIGLLCLFMIYGIAAKLGPVSRHISCVLIVSLCPVQHSAGRTIRSTPKRPVRILETNAWKLMRDRSTRSYG